MISTVPRLWIGQLTNKRCCKSDRLVDRVLSAGGRWKGSGTKVVIQSNSHQHTITRRETWVGNSPPSVVATVG